MQTLTLSLVLLLAAVPQVVPSSPAADPSPSPSPTTSPKSSPSPVPTPGLPTPYPLPTPAPFPAATPAPARTLWPTPSPIPTQLPAPTPLPSASASATPLPIPTPVTLPDDAPPQIVDVHLNQNVIHSGDMVSGWVVTSTNVASVEIDIATYAFGVPRTEVGQFAMSYKAPHIPFFARGNYTARVIARNTKGDRAERDVQIALR
ncbi:MAG: hypothetical protein ACXWNK_10730 [Vulcanimicrobiaceae bacterium]